MVEQRTRNAQVIGSSPIAGSTNLATGCIFRFSPSQTDSQEDRLCYSVLLPAGGGGEQVASNNMAKVWWFAPVVEGDGHLLAPQRFVDWLKTYRNTDTLGLSYQYHPRSDAHSKRLAELIWEDLIAHCPKLSEDAEVDRITYRINFRYQWPGSGKTKTIDLAVGPPGTSGLSEVIISCEIKAAMTEHKKAQPRIFDELQSSYRIVNQGNPKAIAAGITVVNIAKTFVSPLRQRAGQIVEITKHNQPAVTASMVAHLRGLPLREQFYPQAYRPRRDVLAAEWTERVAESIQESGFDAYCTFVVDCGNQGAATLWKTAPAPQPGDLDHYETFLQRICQEYTRRFS